MKRIISTIEEIILINKGLILDLIEEKNIYLRQMNKMGMWVDMNLKMKIKEKPNNPGNFYSFNQDILKYLEKIYIDLDLEELIISEVNETTIRIENAVPSTFFNAIQILSQKSLSEYHNKTNFVLNRNNEEVYQEVKNNVLQKYDITKGEVMIFKGEDNFTFQ